MIIKEGKYYGIITNVKQEKFQTKNKNNEKDFKPKTFEIIKISVRVNCGESGLKDLNARLSKDYAIKYFKEFLGLSSKELINKECVCTIIRKEFTTSNGDSAICNEVKFINLINEKGEAIIMPSEEEVEEIF